MPRRIKIIALTLSVAYLAACCTLYIQQKTLLFPAYVTKPALSTWQPSSAIKSEEALIKGSCGKLQVARWNVANAKGTIMMFHGNGESLTSIEEYVHKFHELGFNLMAWDYPGYGRSSDCWFSQADLLNDAEHAYNWLTKLEKPQNIVIFGYSMGTGIALYIASKHAQNPVFLVAAYDSLLNVAKEKLPPIFPLDLIMQYPLETKFWLTNLKQSVYIIHGSEDTLIPIEHSEKLLAMAPEKVHLEVVKGAGHADVVLFEYRNKWLAKLLENYHAGNP
jgi:uncharacterized protein